MARYNDNTSDRTRWSNAKLIREIRRYANLETFTVGFNKIPVVYREGWHEQVNADQMTVDDFVREQTRLYRDSWLKPLLTEMERRLLK